MSSRITSRNIAPSKRVIKVAKGPAQQRRNRSHLDPRWDSNFVDESEFDNIEPDGHDGAPLDIPLDTTEDATNQPAPPNDQQPTPQRTFTRAEIADAMQRAGHDHALHPQLMDRVSGLLARVQMIPQDDDEEQEQEALQGAGSIVKAVTAINTWLHQHVPTNPWDLPESDSSTSSQAKRGRTKSPSTQSKGRTKSPHRQQYNQQTKGRSKSPVKQQTKGRTKSPCRQTKGHTKSPATINNSTPRQSTSSLRADQAETCAAQLIGKAL